MSKKGRTSILLLGALVTALLCFPLVYFAYGARIDRSAINRRMALLEATAAFNPAALQARYRAAQERFLPILPPDPENRLNPSGGIVVFDPANFNWAAGLEPAELNGVPVYPVTVAEDPESRNTIFYNGSVEVICTLAPEQDYAPFAWLAERNPEYYAVNADPDARAWAEAVYDPARVSMTYYLLAEDDVEAMAEAQVGALAPQMEMMLFGEDPEVPPTNLVIFAIAPVSNGMALGIAWPEDFTNKIEVFARAAIASSGWSIVSGQLPTAGSNSLWWTEITSSTNGPVRFFRVGNADQDADTDGLTDARERMTWGTDESSADTDLDGLVDFQEVIELRTDPLNDDTNKPSIQVLLPQDNIRFVWVP